MIKRVPLLLTLPSLLMDPRRPLIHRDLSWLQFNDRVLAESRASSKNPLLERAKFLAISYSNLDEFFAIRVASLKREIDALKRRSLLDQARIQGRIRSAILDQVARFGIKQAESLEVLAKELKIHKIQIAKPLTKHGSSYELGRKIFETEILPKIEPPNEFSPLALSGLGNLQLGVLFGRSVWFKIPKGIPASFVGRSDETGEYFIFFLDHLLQWFLGPTFRVTGSVGLIRLTRDGELTLDLEEEDTESIPDVIRTGLRSRDRGRPVRLQYSGSFSKGIPEKILHLLRLDTSQVLPVPHTLYLNGLWSAVNLLPENLPLSDQLRYRKFQAAVPANFRNASGIFDSLKQRDFILHHPYDSFDAFVNWILTTCEDPSVISIEQTIYRTDALSPIMEALKRAATRKKIRVVIELRARFDELNNLKLAEELRASGIEVAFGFGKLKLHAKVALVTRQEAGGIKHYTHLSTGNYHSATARQYTDMAILTSHPEIGQDARHFFDSIWNGTIPTSFKKLVSAPSALHRRIRHHIESEVQAAQAGKQGRIFAKVNALVDQGIIDSLYRASQAGVKVDLVVRGACSLIPGVRGLSENIRVISIVDRFLEHSRIYYFENSKAMYLSSADWMPRNFFSRLELAFPILDERIYRFLTEVAIPTCWADTVKARELTPQGVWRKRSPPSGTLPLRCQFRFEELAAGEYKETPLDFS